jgi:hypothetical protein
MVARPRRRNCAATSTMLIQAKLPAWGSVAAVAMTLPAAVRTP